MPSENAKAVAKNVIKAIRKGQKVNLGEIIRDQGYSQSISESPQRVTETLSYQKVMKPIVGQMEEQRQEILLAIANKNKDGEEFKTLIEGMDKLTKNIQLLSGGATERQIIVLPSELTDKNEADTSAKHDS